MYTYIGFVCCGQYKRKIGFDCSVSQEVLSPIVHPPLYHDSRRNSGAAELYVENNKVCVCVCVWGGGGGE